MVFCGCSASFKNKENIDLSKVTSFAQHDKDVGSVEVQIARLTARVEQISGHLRVNRKDYSSKRGLEAVLSQRKSLMKYLYKADRYVACGCGTAVTCRPCCCMCILCLPGQQHEPHSAAYPLVQLYISSSWWLLVVFAAVASPCCCPASASWQIFLMTNTNVRTRQARHWCPVHHHVVTSWFKPFKCTASCSWLLLSNCY
jgi:small subunit ribosomal protein S15